MDKDEQLKKLATDNLELVEIIKRRDIEIEDLKDRPPLYDLSEIERILVLIATTLENIEVDLRTKG